MPRKSESRECGCGCGDWTRGGRFLPGHDARYRSDQVKLHARMVELVGYFQKRQAEEWYSGNDWLRTVARRYCDVDVTGMTDLGVAHAILTHPRMQDTEHNRRNGWTPYTTPSDLYRRILRSCS